MSVEEFDDELDDDERVPVPIFDDEYDEDDEDEDDEDDVA